MMRKWTLLLFACFAGFLSANAQQLCGFDKVHLKLKQNNAAYLQKVLDTKTHWVQLQQNINNGLVVTNNGDTIYQMPVVIHVIHTGGVVGSIYNPTDAQLTGMVDYLNQSYAATYAAYPDSSNGGTYFPVKFIMAQRDPQCNATTGIVRVDGSGLAGYTANGVNLDNTNGADEATVKALSNWNHNDYYNIWVVDKIDGANGTAGTFVAGYAYFPGAPATIDGTIMLATQAIAGQITLPHEVGHAFGVYHTFEGGSSTVCPTNNNCATDGDEVCDTDPEMQSVFNCPTGTNPCTGTPFGAIVHNFMDYSSCQDRFTKGQRTKWIYNMLNNRASLLSSLGGLAPGTATVAATCIPTITNAGNTLDVGPVEVKLNDMTATTDGGYTGDGNLVYIDKTCIQRANVQLGQSYDLSVQTGAYAEDVAVYIDYNNDGTFAASELVYSHVGNASNQVHATTITIPSTGVVTCTPLRMRVVADRSSAGMPTACSALAYGQAEDYSVIVQGPSGAAGNTVAIIAGGNPSCNGSTLTFVATPSGTPTAATYKWYINGVYSGTAADTFITAAPVNGDVVTAKIFYLGPCGFDSSVSSNSVTVIRAASVAPIVTIALTTGQNPGCAGQALTFTATPTTGGTAPMYTWLINGNPAGAAQLADSFVTSSLSNGSVVSVQMASNSSCASPSTATSTGITVNFTTITASVTNTMITGINPACAGDVHQFKATPTNGGTAPTYKWYVNGTYTGVTTDTFTTTTLTNGAIVTVKMTSNNTCVGTPLVTSNQIVIVINPTVTPTLAINITQGSNPGCTDTLIVFTATGANLGPNNVYTWYINGVASGVGGPTFPSSTFQNGDVITARVITTGTGCRTTDTAMSSATTLVLGTTPAPPVISFINGQLIADPASAVQWYGPNGIIPGAISITYNPTTQGLYYAVSIGTTGCKSTESNVLLVSLLSIGNYDMSGVTMYPNPAASSLTIDWGGSLVSAQITLYTTTGQKVLTATADHESRKTLNVANLPSGIYFLMLQDATGKTGMVQVQVQH